MEAQGPKTDAAPIIDAPTITVQSPPPAAQPARIEPDPARRLRELAGLLMQTRNRALMLEYLRLRRAG